MNCNRSCKTAVRDEEREKRGLNNDEKTSTKSKTAFKIQYSHNDAESEDVLSWNNNNNSFGIRTKNWYTRIWIQYTSKFPEPCAKHVQVICVWFFQIDVIFFSWRTTTKLEKRQKERKKPNLLWIVYISVGFAVRILMWCTVLKLFWDSTTDSMYQYVEFKNIV